MAKMIRTEQEERTIYSATTFRILLDSLAHPGKIHQLTAPSFLGEPPCPITLTTQQRTANGYAPGALLTLLDREVTFAVVVNGMEVEHNESLVQWLAVRSGSCCVDAARANFVLFCDGKCGKILEHLDCGTLLEPELSATAMLCVKQLHNTSASSKGVHCELTGPGIETKRLIIIEGMERGDIEAILRTRQGYPLGVDVYLIDAQGQCIGLPRTTRIHVQHDDVA